MLSAIVNRGRNSNGYSNSIIPLITIGTVDKYVIYILCNLTMDGAVLKKFDLSLGSPREGKEMRHPERRIVRSITKREKTIELCIL